MRLMRMQLVLALCLLLVLDAAVAFPAEHPGLQLPVFSLAELQDPTSATLDRVGQAIESLGLFAVKEAEDEGLSHNTLQHFVGCVSGGHLDGHLNEVPMEDRTLRRTLATSTNASTPQPLLPSARQESCPAFLNSATHLRASVAATGQAYARVLDTLLYGDAACSSPAQCFTGAVQDAESLEHFHVFELQAQHATGSAQMVAPSMLSMHSDIGLFLVMTHAHLFGASGSSAGSPTRDLRVSLPDGRVVEPIFPSNALLVMNGEGVSMWMRRGSGTDAVRPWSPLHEVLHSDLEGGMRAWFGRMYFPRRTAVLQHGAGAGSLTFNQYRQQTYAAFKEGRGNTASAAGCTHTRQLLVDEGSCKAGEVYCWHSCLAISPSLTCSKENIICQNTNDGTLWPRDYLVPGSSPGHCYDCAPACPAGSPSNTSGPASSPPHGSSPTRPSFCNTQLYATTMWMGGFQFAAGHENSPCVVYLFPEWVLDSRPKFGAACFGTFIMGLLVGALTKLRLLLKAQAEAHEVCSAWQDAALNAAVIAVIAVQVTLGYFLMLVAMTYQGELFIMVVLGLAFGHIFNLKSASSHGKKGGCGEPLREANQQHDALMYGQGGRTEHDEPLEPCACSV